MSKKDWIGLVIYTVALALVFAALAVLPDHAPQSTLQIFQR